MTPAKIHIHRTTRVVVLTGAGVSAESGIKTFRDSDGLWENHNIEDVATPEAWLRNPELVWDFYKQRYANARSAEPNPGHYALADLETRLGKNFWLITQNVDGLHRRAGNKNLLEMHGCLEQAICVHCGARYPMATVNLAVKVPECPRCEEFIRPDIVWFGEIPYHLEEIEQVIRQADLFLVLGTSGTVYPAAGFVMAAKYRGATTVGINLEEPHNMQYFDHFHIGKTGELLPALLQDWLHI